MEEELKRQWPSFISRRNITLGAALLVIIAGSIGYCVYTKSRVSPQQAQQQEIASLVAALRSGTSNTDSPRAGSAAPAAAAGRRGEWRRAAPAHRRLSQAHRR